MMFVDQTGQIADPGPRRLRREPIDHIFIHRLGPKFPGWGKVTSAVDVAQFFENHPEVRESIGRCAYQAIAFAADANGPTRIEQAVALRYHTPHALTWSLHSIGIAVWGDWRHEIPPVELTMLVEDFATFLSAMYSGAKVVGHDEPPKWDPNAPPTSSDPDKECPGMLYPVKELRANVKDRLKAGRVPQFPVVV
jgi:hypothetical protein